MLFSKIKKRCFEGKKSSNNIINNDTVSDDKVVAVLDYILIFFFLLPFFYEEVRKLQIFEKSFLRGEICVGRNQDFSIFSNFHRNMHFFLSFFFNHSWGQLFVSRTTETG